MADIEAIKVGIRLALKNTNQRRQHQSVDGYMGGEVLAEAIGLGTVLGRVYGEVFERQLLIDSLDPNLPGNGRLRESLTLDLNERTRVLGGCRDTSRAVQKSETVEEGVISLAKDNAARVARRESINDVAKVLGASVQGINLELKFRGRR